MFSPARHAGKKESNCFTWNIRASLITQDAIKRPVGALFDANGGGGGIRTLVTRVTGKTVFETAAFNHSATPPRGVRGQAPYGTRLAGASVSWRRDRDSNPRYSFGAHTISNRAPSASRSSLRSSETCMLALGADVQQLRSIQQLIGAHKREISILFGIFRDSGNRRALHAQGDVEQRAHSVV